MKTTVSFFILTVLTVFFTGNANFPVGSLYAASRQVSIGSSEMGKIGSKGVSTHAGKQNAVTRHRKGKGLFKRLFAFGKLKKEVQFSEETEPGKCALVSLVSGFVFNMLPIIPVQGFLLVLFGLLSLIGIALFIKALVLGKRAKKHSTGKDRRMGVVSMWIARILLIGLVVTSIILAFTSFSVGI